MKILKFLISFCIFVHATLVSAGPLETLSEKAFAITGNKCEPSSSQKSSADKCDPKDSETKSNLKDAKEVAQLAGQSEEDRYFALLGNQQVRELQCASDFAKQTVAQNTQYFANGDLKQKLMLARQVRAQTKELAKKIVSDPMLATPVCPLNFESLEAQYKGLKKGANYKACKELISYQGSYQVIMASIPLSGAPEVKKALEKYTSSASAMSDKEIVTGLNKAYTETQKTLDENKANLTQSLVGQGGAGLNRTARHDLLADPALSSAVLKSEPGLSDVACMANARYGHGADNLNNGVMIGSMFLGGGAAVAEKVGAFTAKAFSTAEAARTVGLVSYNAMRMMKYTVMGTDFATMSVITDQACFKTKFAELKTGAACVSAPTAERLPQDSCIMAASLTALGVVPQQAISAVSKKVLKAITDEQASEAARIASADDFFESPRTGKKKPAAAAMETSAATSVGASAVEKRLSEGTIVSEKRVGMGVYGARFVKYEDGSEGVWKPRALIDQIDTAKGEVAAYKIDKYLGLNSVPVTVMKENKGEIGTVQYRVKNLKAESPYQTFADDPDQLGFFDYLLANGDRHGFNYLQKEDGKMVAIDHGLSFGSGSGKLPFQTFQGNVIQLDRNLKAQDKLIKSIEKGGSKTDSLKQELADLKKTESALQSAMKSFVPPKEVIEKLRATKLEDWQRVTDGNLTKYQIEEMLDRQERLLRAIDIAEKKVGADRLYPSGDSSPLIKKVQNRYYSE